MKNITFKDSKGREWNYQIPFEITCTVSGAVKVYTAEDYINGKIERFDGLDNLRATFVCRDAKKAVKVAKQEGKTEITIGDKTVEVKPDPVISIKFDKPEAPKPLTKADATPDSCYNPKFLLDGKPCSTCAFVGVCLYKDSPKGKLLIQKKKKAAA
jgi:hypothetical protein